VIARITPSQQAKAIQANAWANNGMRRRVRVRAQAPLYILQSLAGDFRTDATRPLSTAPDRQFFVD
jgi:hypothetical protein